MPRKYTYRHDDIMFFTGIVSMYEILRPIEDKLRAAGYRGPILADFSNVIYTNLNENKTTDLNYVEVAEQGEYKSPGPMHIVEKVEMDSVFTEESDKKMQKYFKKLDDYLDLLIKNTPPEEYSEELSDIKLHKTLLRTLRTFGSNYLFNDQLGFISNIKAYDADTQTIKDIGNNANPEESREKWRLVKKNYPYSDLRDAMVEIANVACDYEESKDKNSYTTQIDYREKYKKGLQNFIDAYKKLSMGEEEKERIAKAYIRDDIISNLKKADGPDKNVDYYAIIKRVEEQEEYGYPIDPEEKTIVDNIRTRVNDKYNIDYTGYDWCNSKYGYELAAVGYKVSEKDFTGNRGNGMFIPEIEAQLNAIDMGWPMDELIHIQRLFNISRGMTVIYPKEGVDFNAFKNRCRTFYNERIKDKPYPSTEEERQAFYQDFYALGQEASEVTRGRFLDPNDEEAPLVECSYTALMDGIRKSMDKPLSYTQKLVQKHVLSDEPVELNKETVLNIKDKINVKKKLAHMDSSEFDRLKNAFAKFSDKFLNGDGAFKIGKYTNLSPENLKILTELRDAAKAYLEEKDKEERAPEERSIMGKERYEGAAKVFLLASNLVRKNEKSLEEQAKEKKEAERIKGRKEIKEAFFKTGTEAAEKSIEYDKKKAGGEEKYNELIEKERREEAEALQKEPATDDEKYERLINSLRTKKDDPVTEEDEYQNNELQQTRISNYAKMLAAIELQKEGKPYEQNEINKRSEQLRNIYSLDILKKVSDNQNGPEKLKNALTFKFRAEELKKELEESLYEVRKTDFSSIFEAQNKYQHDLAEVLNRKRTAELSNRTLKVVNAINDILYFNLKNKSEVVINGDKLRKANAKLMKAITEAFEDTPTMDKEGFGTKLVLDTLAVLTTYTGCQAVTNKLIGKINSTIRDRNGYLHNINIANFTKNYGVDHSKDVSERVRRREHEHPVNNPVNNL